MIIKIISATSLKLYEACPFQWKLKYVDKLEPLPNDNLLIGIKYHTAVQLFHEGKDKELIVSNLKSEMLSEKPTDKEIDNFGLVRVLFEKYTEYPIEGETLETEYKFYVKSPKLPLPFFGYIDRIMPKEIVDYKTTSVDYKQEDIEDNPATDIYSYAFWRKYGEMPRIIYHVINKKKVHKPNYKPQILETTRTQDDIRRLFKRCQEFCDNVNAENFKHIKYHPPYWCSFGVKC